MTKSEKDNFMQMIEAMIDEVSELQEEANSDHTLIGDCFYDEEKKVLIDHFLQKKKEMNSKMSEFSTLFYNFWLHTLHGPENTYQKYFITVRDSMQNKYYGVNYIGEEVWLKKPDKKIEPVKTTLF